MTTLPELRSIHERGLAMLKECSDWFPKLEGARCHEYNAGAYKMVQMLSAAVAGLGAAIEKMEYGDHDSKSPNPTCRREGQELYDEHLPTAEAFAHVIKSALGEST